MALQFYSVTDGETRDITQADVDELLAIRASHGRVMSFLADERVRVLNEVRDVRAKAARVEQEVKNG